MADHFKSPLTIYVLWHPKFTDGLKFADRLFNTLSRNVDDPFMRTIGIPVYYRSQPENPKESMAPAPIRLDESEYNAIVVFVDAHMLLNKDWKAYVKDLLAKMESAPNRTRVFPMANDFTAFKSKELGAINYIRMYEADKRDDEKNAGDESSGSDDSAIRATEARLRAREAWLEEREQALMGQAGSGVSLAFGQPAGQGNGISINITINNADSSATPGLSTNLTGRGGSARQANSEATAVTEPVVTAASPETDDAERILERRGNLMISRLVHELCRLMLSHPQVCEAGTTRSGKPVNLFLSHAKADGAEIAKEIKKYIEEDSSAKTFFDANDIAPGYRFSDELIGAIRDSALVCIQTDYYATREWCLFEVITAKRFGRPVVVLNAVKEREPRSFPYIGNVPTMRWNPKDKSRLREVVDLALFEVLDRTYNRLFLKALRKLYTTPRGTHSVGHPPELFTILRMREDEKKNGEPAGPKNGIRYVLYPDPPLGDEEIRLLQDLSPDLRFITPTMLPVIELQSHSS